MDNPLGEALRLILSGDPALWEIVRLSLFVSGTAIVLAGAAGVPLGAWLGMRRVRGDRWLTAFIYTGMGFPPVVIGLAVYLLLSRRGPLGGLNWLLTPTAMILAQVILALPLVVGVTLSAVRGVDPALRPQLRALGATEWQVTTTVLREARQGVIVGLVAGFGAAISEVGAVMLVGGNIFGRTRVLTTAIVLETRQGRFDIALALGLILLLLAFLVNMTVVTVQRRGALP
jgi:tungstate transport system permease protein